MGLEEFIKQLDWSKLAFFVLFALPGFISLQVWSLIVPTNDRPLKEAIPEAVGFGVLNAVIGVPLLLTIAPTQTWGPLQSSGLVAGRAAGTVAVRTQVGTRTA